MLRHRHFKLFIDVKLKRWIFTQSQDVNGLNNTRTDEIKLYLQQRNNQFLDTWTCFQCHNSFLSSLSQAKKQTNTNDLKTCNFSNYFINKMTGDFTCPANNDAGTWNDLLSFCGKNKSIPGNVHSKYNDDSVMKIYKNSTRIADLEFNRFCSLLSKFKLNAVKANVLSDFDICCNEETDEVIIPFWDIAPKQTQLVGIKVIHDPDYCTQEGSSHLTSSCFTIKSLKGSDLKFFGLREKDLKKHSVVITANEFDALAINSCSLKHAAIALPYGASNLPLHLLPYVEIFSELILWFGSELSSIEAAKMFAEKLNSSRCRAVRPSPNISTAMHVLNQGLDIDEIISSAAPTRINNIVTFTDLQSEIKDELLNKEKFAGVPYKRFSNLNKKIKGHRRGELSVLTGPTGAGKTTLLSELSLDLAVQGVRTLWGSFEITNKRLLSCMFKQFSRDFTALGITKFEDIASKFKELPLLFMTYKGPKGIDDVIKTMYEVTYARDIQHIIIDNLQFMMGTELQKDRFWYQDYVFAKFRKFASKYHVHITIVVHPRKEDQNLPIQLSSVFGSAKVTQEADNVFILQQTRAFKPDSDTPILVKYLEVAKNRYDGELGRIKLYFNRSTQCLSPEPDLARSW